MKKSDYVKLVKDELLVGIYNIFNSYYLEMELWFTNKLLYDYDTAIKKIKELEEENKKLKEELDIATKCSCKEEAWIIRLSEENETLKANVEFLHSCLDDREASIELMKERIRFLEQCLDNKEKVNKQLRKDIKWYEKEEDRLREENKRLSDFLECES